MALLDNHHQVNDGILVVEDSPTQAEQLRQMLAQRYKNVTVAANGKEALLAARQQKPSLVISDVVMPVMDGYALCRALKSDNELSDVPVVLVTTLSDSKDVIEGLACGADNFIRKPYNARYLLSRIDHILANRELRESEKTQMGMKIVLGGQSHFISSERQQILDLLIGTYEEAVRLNDELRSHAAQLEAANAELESFSYSVSHDLRAPLRAIDGFTRMLEADYADRLDDEGRRMLGVVGESSRKMGMLIDDLLAFSRLGRKPITSAQIDIGRLVGEVLDELRGQFPDRWPAVTVDPLPPVPGDRTLIRQVWVNLLSNAVKFSAKAAAPVIRVCGRTEGAEVIFSVQDNGVGFDMQYHGKLFGVFQRLHSAEEFPGTGVGLAIVHRAVTRHGGRVWAEGKPDEGATFYFALPRSLSDLAPTNSFSSLYGLSSPTGC